MVIFDSRKAASVYKSHNHYRSQNFSIPEGCVALVELTTRYDSFDKVVFTAVRTPFGFGDKCYDLEGVGKRYRQLDCSNTLPYDIESEGSNTEYTGYRKSIWRLGNDKYNEKVYEYRYINRPGDYYLLANKDSNQLFEDCTTPTIVEVFILPASFKQNVCNEG